MKHANSYHTTAATSANTKDTSTKAAKGKTAKRSFISRYAGRLILLATTILSVSAFAWFYLNGHQNLADYDAIARLNIARKILDSTAPGFGQLGGIWLPFPQILMVPLIWSDFLWRSGIAGAVISMAAFITGAYFLFKTVLLLTKNHLAAFVAWLAFATNVNLLWLQTMAMSESFFLTGIIMVVYGLTKWVVDKKLSSLLLAAFFVMIVTLTRYEGYAVLGASFITVALSLFFLKNKRDQAGKTEGILIMFGTLASLGILLWTIYSWLIYHDPIYWLNLYSGTKNVVEAPAGTTIPVTSGSELFYNAERNHPLSDSAATYTWAMALMLGIPVTLAALAGFLTLAGSSIRQAFTRKIELRFMPLTIITTIMLAFVIFGYWRGLIPPIEVPAASLDTLMTKASNLVSHTNIRYGLIMLPIAAILIGYLAAKRRIIGGLLALLIIEQVVLGLTTNYFVQFQLPAVSTYTVPAEIKWFKTHYDGGMILTSAQRHEPFILQSELPYKTFIFEGSRQLWVDSLANPAAHATWIVIRHGDEGDAVDQFINKAEFKAKYQPMRLGRDLQIYRLREDGSDGTPTPKYIEVTK